MVGLGNSTSIEDPLTVGDSATSETSSIYKYFTIKLPSNFTGTMGKFDWGGTYSTSRANWMCVGASGTYYFFRSSSSNPRCTMSTWSLFGSYAYTWSGFAFSGSTAGVMASSGEMKYKLHKVAPEPDTSAPVVTHGAMKDSHAKDRTFTFTIADGGAPPSGVDTTPSLGVGPTLYYRQTGADGTVYTWNSTLLNPSDSRANCT